MKNKYKLILDGILFAILWIVMAYTYTGNLWHEILGAALLVGFLLHVGINWKYYLVMFRKLGSTNHKSKFSFGVNLALLVSVIAMVITSMAISRDLFAFWTVSDESFFFWRTAHVVFSLVIMICMLLHVCLHFSMFDALFAKHNASERARLGFKIGTRVLAFFLAGVILYLSIRNAMIIVDDYERRRKSDSTDSYLSGVGTGVEIESQSSEQQTVTELLPRDEEKIGDSNPQHEESIGDSNPQDEEKIVNSDSEDIPTQEEYLQTLNCNGCGRHCCLLTPQCGKGVRQAETAKQEYNRLYGVSDETEEKTGKKPTNNL